MRNLCTGGSILLLLVSMSALGCRSSYQAPMPEPPPTDDRNVCGWPDYCHPMTARDMMQEILDLALADEPQGGIHPEDLESIRESFARITDPSLTNSAGKHVCHLQNPIPCDELRQIYEKVQPENLPKTVKAHPGHWHTIAQELESFPTGN